MLRTNRLGTKSIYPFETSEMAMYPKVLVRVDAIRERFYLISVERKLKQPAVAAIAEMAREKLFS